MSAKVNAAQIWAVLCEGKVTATEVGEAVGISRSHAAVYLRIFAEIGLVRRGDRMRVVNNRPAHTFTYEPNYEVARLLGW